MIKDGLLVESRLIFLGKVSDRYINSLGKVVHAKGLYKCRCGKIKEINIGNVKSGKIISCGCYRNERCSIANKKRSITHGLSYHPLFKIWAKIKERCYNKKNNQYHNYGGRGVVICDEWMKFINFYKWAIDNGWRSGMVIDKDKKPYKLGIKATIYSPEMCSIVTPNENSLYKRTSRFITFNNETKTLSEWSNLTGISSCLIKHRMKNGWSINKTLLTKPKTYKKCV